MSHEMTYDAKAVANFILGLGTIQGDPITPMKLQKLLFYAHGWHLALTEEPLFGDPVEAWQYGPVVPVIYHDFKDYGNEPIRSRAGRFLLDGDDLTVQTPEIPSSPDVEDTRRILTKVWEIFSPVSSVELSNMTHAPGSPWSQVTRKTYPALPAGLRIPNHLIKDYFSQARKGA